ncbi:MAG: FAD-binding protein [Gemmatimonadaceae bacterium]|nr:FAD-binding protein [Chitinophagaceae bacterium]
MGIPVAGHFGQLLVNFIQDLNSSDKYDVAIAGGGLGGLALSIQLARSGHSVVLLEKETYPFHRVCGEYISLECWNFLENLGYPLSDMDLPLITNLLVSAPDGRSFQRKLPLGGFGISRYKIDADLAAIARLAGVNVIENCKVNDIRYDQSGFTFDCNGKEIRSQVAAGSFGKRSNLDLKWKRPFATRKPGKLSNYIGVKYHIRTDLPADSIALHNFDQGYCGISRVEDGKYCLCYLTTARQLKNAGGISALEQSVLSKNPFLKKIFSESVFEMEEAVTIAQVSFARKSQVENHVLMVGDAAGMIAPLCGNGMSMALHASKIAAGYISLFLAGEISREAMEEFYVSEWKRSFSGRLRTGRLIQGLFGASWLTNLFVGTLRPFPKIITYLIRQTHGEPF